MRAWSCHAEFVAHGIRVVGGTRQIDGRFGHVGKLRLPVYILVVLAGPLESLGPADAPTHARARHGRRGRLARVGAACTACIGRGVHMAGRIVQKSAEVVHHVARAEVGAVSAAGG